MNSRVFTPLALHGVDKEEGDGDGEIKGSLATLLVPVPMGVSRRAE